MRSQVLRAMPPGEE